jgi:hypothetical protein
MAASLPWFCLILIAGRPVFVSAYAAKLAAPTALRKSHCRTGRERWPSRLRSDRKRGETRQCRGVVSVERLGTFSIAVVDSGSQRSKTMVN